MFEFQVTITAADGYQWVSTSFADHIEDVEGRACKVMMPGETLVVELLA